MAFITLTKVTHVREELTISADGTQSIGAALEEMLFLTAVNGDEAQAVGLELSPEEWLNYRIANEGKIAEHKRGWTPEPMAPYESASDAGWNPPKPRKVGRQP